MQRDMILIRFSQFQAPVKVARKGIQLIHARRFAPLTDLKFHTSRAAWQWQTGQAG